jgi:hypothetical protein
VNGGSPIGGEAARRQNRRTWPAVLLFAGLGVLSLAGLPLRTADDDSAVRIGPASPLLPPTPIVVGETPPAAVEPGFFRVSGGGSFSVGADQEGMEAVRLSTRCGPAQLPGVAIAADGSFGASTTSLGRGIWIEGRFERPDTARGNVRVLSPGCDSGRVPFVARHL